MIYVKAAVTTIRAERPRAILSNINGTTDPIKTLKPRPPIQRSETKIKRIKSNL